MRRAARALTLASALTGLGLGLGLWATPNTAMGFCGFYVAGADAELYNDATMVVMMRDGTRTVLSMQNDYQGPPEDFALVIPVPVVLQEGEVKTLPDEVFDRVDKLAAPRLVEYWEKDPCKARARQRRQRMRRLRYDDAEKSAVRDGGGFGVTVEAEFEVGEYDIVILSAEDSTGLDGWLRANEYNIPEGAQPFLDPYVTGGMNFFVAKVDAQKVKFQDLPNGGKRAMLSPLRFHYDSEEFALPVRLGLINAKGPQDLLVHILAPETRYQVANYPNVTIPTNLTVQNQVREHFGKFYVSLFDHTLAQSPKAVVTEYAWAASSCDPCPEPALSLDELILLGADVLPRFAEHFDEQGQLAEGSSPWEIQNAFVLTRLHARYDADALGEDLVFEQAPALIGGRGMPEDGRLDPEVHEGAHVNNFQGRYAILHFWDGPVRCLRPLWDQWGGPPDGADAAGPAVAQELAFAPRDAKLASFVTRSSHQRLELAGDAPEETRPRRVKQAQAEADGESRCKCELDEQGRSNTGLLAGLLGLGLGLGIRTRRRRKRSS